MKMERALGIIMLLLNKKRLNTKDLAEHYEVSTRTIKRDMELLARAGVPIVSFQGQRGGYELLEDYTLDKSFFTRGETSFLKDLMANLDKIWKDDNLKSINDKLSHIGKDSTESPVYIDFDNYNTNKINEELKLIKEAIENSCIIKFDYINNKGEKNARDVEPYKLLLKNGVWYLDGYSRDKVGFRRFRLVRVQNLSITKEIFVKRTFEPINKWQGKEVHLDLVFEPEAFTKLDYYFPNDSIIKLENGKYGVEVDYREDEWVYSILLSFGHLVTIKKPKHIREIVLKRAKLIVEKLEKEI